VRSKRNADRESDPARERAVGTRSIQSLDRESLLLHAQEQWISQGYTLGTVAHFVAWAKRFGAHCKRRRIDEVQALRRVKITAYAAAYVRERGLDGRVIDTIRTNLRQWARALASLGVQVPEWKPQPRIPTSALLAEYHAYLLRVRGVGLQWTVKAVDVAARFIIHLKKQKKRPGRVVIDDIDQFLMTSARVAPGSLPETCCALRHFLRFLHATGRAAADLSPAIVGPRRKVRPVRGLPWPDVRRIIKGTRSPGRVVTAELGMSISCGHGTREQRSLGQARRALA
jgi:hypothetical protein